MSNTLRYLMANLVLAYKALLGPKAFVVFTKYHKSLEFGGRKVVSGGLYPVSMMRVKGESSGFFWLFFAILRPQMVTSSQSSFFKGFQGDFKGLEGVEGS